MLWVGLLDFLTGHLAGMLVRIACMKALQTLGWLFFLALDCSFLCIHLASISALISVMSFLLGRRRALTELAERPRDDCPECLLVARICVAAAKEICRAANIDA